MQVRLPRHRQLTGYAAGQTWPSGTTEPSGWFVDGYDSTASLAQAGDVGLGAFLPNNTSNAPITFTYDDLTVTDLSADPPDPTPTPTPRRLHQAQPPPWRRLQPRLRRHGHASCPYADANARANAHPNADRSAHPHADR